MRKYLNVLVEPAPHSKGGKSTEKIMAGVWISLLPVWGLSIYKYGLVSLWIGLISMVVCLGFEYLVLDNKNKRSILGDYSALITGLLFALTLPPSLPFWMVGLGAFICMSLGKHAFGGLGNNPFNPAIVGRVFLQISFTAPMTHWTAPFQVGRFSQIMESNLAIPFLKPTVDAISSATALGRYKFEGITTDWISFLFDQNAGSLGEVSPLLFLVLGGILAWIKFLDWRIPASIFVVTVIFSGLLQVLAVGPNIMFVLCSGGYMLGAIFMATDMVTSPITPFGVWLYGGLIAFLVVMIRTWGGLAEGMAFAILIGNAMTPLIHIITQPRVYGTVRRGKNHE